jgi:hypothetical protein
VKKEASGRQKEKQMTQITQMNPEGKKKSTIIYNSKFSIEHPLRKG